MTHARFRSLVPRPGVLRLLVFAVLVSFASLPAVSFADSDVSQSYVFPVPFRPSSGQRSVIFTLLPSEGNIRIYTATGELVRKLEFVDPVDGKLEWDVTNSGGEPLGSDVYIYVVQSGDNKKFGKLVVIR